MLSHYRAVQQVARKIGSAVDASVDALKERRVEQEPAFTDRMLGRIEGAVDGFRSKGISWSAKTLTDRAPNSQESKFGADFLVVVDFDLPDYKVSKGFLAQAKLLKNGKVKDIPELVRQCEKMLEISPGSYVFLYDDEQVRVVPAISVTGSDSQPVEHYSQSASHFFEEHLKCFVGDRRLNAPSIDIMKSLKDEIDARTALWLNSTVTENGTDLFVGGATRKA